MGSRHTLSAHQRGYGAAHRAARLVVLERDRWRCQWRFPGCLGVATEADHLGAKVPDPDQMVAACKPCNAHRGALRALAHRRAARARPSREW